MDFTEVYKMAGAEIKLMLRVVKSRKLRYVRHVMRLPHDNIECSVITVMTGRVEGS